jgi:hypothetical protein
VKAYEEVMNKANRINDQIIRKSFLERARVNRAIIGAGSGSMADDVAH